MINRQLLSIIKINDMIFELLKCKENNFVSSFFLVHEEFIGGELGAEPMAY